MNNMKSTTVMTQEEAIERLEWYQCHVETKEDANAFDMAISALRPVSRERVEKVWRGCQSCKSCRSCVYSIYDLEDMPCKKCYTNSEGIATEYKPSNFCPNCGKPLTDEAVQMVMERWEALKDET